MKMGKRCQASFDVIEFLLRTYPLAAAEKRSSDGRLPIHLARFLKFDGGGHQNKIGVLQKQSE